LGLIKEGDSLFKNSNYILLAVILYFIFSLTGIFPIEIFENKFFNILGEISVIVAGGLVVMLLYKLFKKENQDE